MRPNRAMIPETIRVALPVFPGVSAATVMGFFDVLTCAGRACQGMTGEEAPRRLFDPVLVGSRCGGVACANGASLNVACEFDSVRDPDLVIVSAILVPPPELTAGLDARFLAWLQSVHRRGSAVASVCSGSLALAEAPRRRVEVQIFTLE